jgi:hypothetical protein
MRHVFRRMARIVAALSVTGAAAGGAPQAPPGGAGQALVPPALLKLLIEHPILTKYIPRGPLLVSDSLLEPGLVPSRFGQRVEVVGDSELGDRACLRLLSFDVRGLDATAVAEYRAQQVEFHFALKRSAAGWWRVVGASSRVAAR